MRFRSYNSVANWESEHGMKAIVRDAKPMRRMPWPVYLWPGLPQLARDGNWAALAFAVAAAAILNVVLLGTWFWTDLFAPALRIIVWVLLGVAWSISAGYWAWTDRPGHAQRVGGGHREDRCEDF